MKHILHRFKKRRVFLWRYESFPAPPDGDWLALPDIPPHVRVEDFLPHLSLTFFPHLISARRSVEKRNYAHSFTHFNLFFFLTFLFSSISFYLPPPPRSTRPSFPLPPNQSASTPARPPQWVNDLTSLTVLSELPTL